MKGDRRTVAYRNSAGKAVENRFYFRDGQLFNWVGTQKKMVSPSDGDFKSEADRLTGNFKSFVVALNGKGGVSKSAPAFQTTHGTFVGIEKGDYSHWLTRTDAGHELSLFILNPTPAVDKVIANPKAFKGRKYRVRWEESVENIPEAGGKIKVQQILDVEWLGKK